MIALAKVCVGDQTWAVETRFSGSLSYIMADIARRRSIERLAEVTGQTIDPDQIEWLFDGEAA